MIMEVFINSSKLKHMVIKQYQSDTWKVMQWYKMKWVCGWNTMIKMIFCWRSPRFDLSFRYEALICECLELHIEHCHSQSHHHHLRYWVTIQNLHHGTIVNMFCFVFCPPFHNLQLYKTIMITFTTFFNN